MYLVTEISRFTSPFVCDAYQWLDLLEINKSGCFGIWQHAVYSYSNPNGYTHTFFPFSKSYFTIAQSSEGQVQWFVDFNLNYQMIEVVKESSIIIFYFYTFFHTYKMYRCFKSLLPSLYDIDLKLIKLRFLNLKRYMRRD